MTAYFQAVGPGPLVNDDRQGGGHAVGITIHHIDGLYWLIPVSRPFGTYKQKQTIRLANAVIKATVAS